MKAEDYYKQGHTDYTMEQCLSTDSRIPNILEVLDKRVAKGSKVLDLGCGDMGLSRLRPDYAWTGVDIDNTRTPQAIKHDLGVYPYPLTTCSFDAVVCTEVLEHLWAPEKTLAEIRRVLKPGGTFIVTVPNYDMIDAVLTGYKHLLYHPKRLFSVEHIRQYNVDSPTILLNDVGFKVQDVQGNSLHMSGFFTYPRKRLAQELGIDLIKADQLLGKLFPTTCTGILMVAK